MTIEMAIIVAGVLMSGSTILNAVLINLNISKIERERQEFAEAMRIQRQIDAL